MALAAALAADPQLPEQTRSQALAPTFKANVNEVLLPVVVRDAQAHAVGTLAKDDFQIFDNGKLQPLAGFTLIKRPGAPTAADPATPGRASAPSHNATRPAHDLLLRFNVLSSSYSTT